MPIWQRQPRPIQQEHCDINTLNPGVIVVVRVGEEVYWLTATTVRRLTNPLRYQPYVTGVAAHASGHSAPMTSPAFTSVNQILAVGQQLWFGVEGHLQPVSETSISALRVYGVSGVKPQRVRVDRTTPPTGVDLAQEAPGTVIKLETQTCGDVYLTLTNPMTHNRDEVRGVVITRKEGGAVSHISPYYCIATRHIAPGAQLTIKEEERKGASVQRLKAYVLRVSVNGVPRQ